MLSALIAGGLNLAIASSTDTTFRIFIRGGSAGHQVVAENYSPAPISAYVSLTGGNSSSDRTWPMTVVVPPNSALPLGRVYSKDRNACGYKFLFNYRYNFGHIDAVHDVDAAYRLPFEDGHGFAVIQAYGSPLTRVTPAPACTQLNLPYRSAATSLGHARAS